MDRFSELRAFVTVVEAGGFSAGARELKQSRSAVNRLVIALEERLGVQLLNRSTRHVSVTSDGEAFYGRARRILDDLDEAESAISRHQDEAVGLLRVSAPLTFVEPNIAQAIIDFMRLQPRLKVELNLETRLVDPVAEGYDMVVRVAEPDETTMLVDHRLVEYEYVLCAAPEYLEKRPAPQHPNDLKDHVHLQYHRDKMSPSWRFARSGEAIDVSVDPLLCSNNLDPILAATLAGFGAAVLPGYGVRGFLQRGELVRLLPDYHLPARVLQVIYPPSRRLSAKVRLLTDYLIERFGA